MMGLVKIVSHIVIMLVMVMFTSFEANATYVKNDPLNAVDPKGEDTRLVGQSADGTNHFVVTTPKTIDHIQARHNPGGSNENQFIAPLSADQISTAASTMLAIGVNTGSAVPERGGLGVEVDTGLPIGTNGQTAVKAGFVDMMNLRDPETIEQVAEGLREPDAMLALGRQFFSLKLRELGLQFM